MASSNHPQHSTTTTPTTTQAPFANHAWVTTNGGLEPSSTTFITSTISSLSSLSSLLPSTVAPPPPSSNSSSLFPDLHSADLYLPDEDEYVNDYFDDVQDTDLPFILPDDALSSSVLCSSLDVNASAMTSCLDDAQVQTKVYSVGDLWTENEIFARKLAPAMAFIAFLMIIGLLGNMLVVYVYGLRFKPATQHFLIVCLACFDLVMCSVAMPTEMADMRFHHTFDSVFACKLLRFVTMFASISSSLTLVTVAYDRHRRITRPLSRQMTLKKARLWTLANMAAALFFAWPTLVITGIRTSQTRLVGLQGTDCSFSEEYKKTKFPFVYNAVLGLGFFTLVTVIAVFYFRIWKTARTRKINMAKRYTIGSLSDQSLSELKRQTKVDQRAMSDVLSKQLEKCVRQDLYAKASIDCKDICYFLENNSIRTAVSCGIAKKRGKYKEFSISCPENSSSAKSVFSNSDECVLGQSFSYRKSLYANIKKSNQSDEIEITNNRKKKSRKLSRETRLHDLENSSQNDNNGLNNKASSLQSGSSLGVIDNDSLTGSSDISDISKTKLPNSEIAETKDECGVRIFDRTNYIKRKYGRLMKTFPETAICLRTLHSPKPGSSPSPSLRSNSSSPGIHRRNSSPLLQQRVKVKTRAENSISIISEDLQLRPLSSLVESVSQSLACLREFSEGQSCNAIPRNAYRMSRALSFAKPGVAIMENPDQTSSCNEREVSNAGSGGDSARMNCCEVNKESQSQSHPANTGKYEDALCSHIDTDASEIINPLKEENIVEEEHFSRSSSNDEKYLHIAEKEKSPSPIDYEDNNIIGIEIDPNENLFQSFCHLIGPRTQPMEVGHDVIPTANDNHGYVDNTPCTAVATPTNSRRMLRQTVSCYGENGFAKSNTKHEIVSRLKSESDAHDLTDTTSIKTSTSNSDTTSTTNNTSKNSKARFNLLKHFSSLKNSQSHHSSKICDIQQEEPAASKQPIPSQTPSTPSAKRKPIQSSSAFSEDENESESQNQFHNIINNKPRCYSSSSLETIPRRRAKSSSSSNNGRSCVCLSRNLDKTTVVAFTVSSVFVLSFLPFLILMFIRGLVKDFDYSLDGATLCVYHIFLRFYFLNSAINPFLYGLLNVNFRYECKRMWKRFFRCHGDEKASTTHDAIVMG